MRMHSLPILGAIALTLASAAPSIAPPNRRQPIVPRPPHSPVQCNTGDQPNEAAFSFQRQAGPGPRRSAAPPPPPPMAPSVAVSPPGIVASPNVAHDIVVTGSKRTGPPPPADIQRERYDGRPVAAIRSVANEPVSTFSVDVDTGAYANVRRFLTEGTTPPADAVRTEEMINYFRYDYARPNDRAQPFSVTTDVARTPWNPQSRLLRIGLRGYDVTTAARPRANLVFLVDVSGSMGQPDKLPLVKAALAMLADQLRPDDRVAIVVYAGNAGLVLSPTSDGRAIKTALACLDSGGSTAGGEGIKLAYDTAQAAFVKDGVNRIFLATDGDFNVGISDTRALEALVKQNRDDGITLTALGFGKGNVNDAMMEHIADVGNGNYAYVDSLDEARKVLADELSATLVPIAKDVKVQVEFNPAQVKQYRLIGYENRALAEEDFSNDAVDAGDMGAGHQVTALYEIMPTTSAGWTGARRYADNRPATVGSGGDELCFVKLRYKLPAGGPSRLLTRAVPASLVASAGVPRGDMAFVTAVAAFGQKLRGDSYLGGYRYVDIRALAGDQSDPWRRQFVDLTRRAEGRAEARAD